MTSRGIVYLVGAGPGDAGLLTLRGKQLLERADVVVYDYLSSGRLLDFAPTSAERIYVGKKAAQHTLSQEKISELLVEKARQGKVVVRLKGGDPYVFGRGGEEALALAEANLPFEVVPGVTASIAAAAYAGIPVTHRGIASCFGVVTGHGTPDKPDTSLDYRALASWGGTLAFYMGMENLPVICRELVAAGLPEGTPAAAIRWGTTTQQQTVAATVATLGESVRQAGLKPPAVIIIGQVVALRDRLNWFETRPLFGRRIIVTRSRAQASELTSKLQELGAEVIELPAIRIEPIADNRALAEAVKNVARYNWIIFTSANGVDAFFDELKTAGLDARALAPCKVAAIGPATAGALLARGIVADLQPEKFISSSIVESLIARGELAGKRVLCPRADIAPRDLIDQLEQNGAVVDDIAAYRTVADNANAQHVAELIRTGQVDWVTFTSSSTVDNFFKAIFTERGTGIFSTDNVEKQASYRIGSAQSEIRNPKSEIEQGTGTVSAHGAETKPVPVPPRYATIGPSTSAALRKHGLEPAVEAATYTIDGLVEAIRETQRRFVGP